MKALKGEGEGIYFFCRRRLANFISAKKIILHKGIGNTEISVSINKFRGSTQVLTTIMKRILLAVLSCVCISLSAQKNFLEYIRVYPIGEDPNIRMISTYRPEEKILFEANPTVRYSFYNNFLRDLANNFSHTQAWYLSAKPQLRVYDETSYPVKTPTYRLLLGTQHMYRLPNKKQKDNTENFFAFSLESGHYSNGQAASAFSEDFMDGSAQSDSVYNSINENTDLSKLLNRKNGNFSTNLTEIIINYRSYTTDKENIPLSGHSFNFGLVLYHNRFLGIADFGGYSLNDIKIYGKWRYLFSYEYIKVFKKGEGVRIQIKENVELIRGAMRQINPLRSESSFTLYPFIRSKALGFFASYIYGHDNYNYRLVDSGHQLCLGITWSQFPPFAMSNKLR